MAERPILFSGPMVRAILAGHKTQTRRVVKPQFGRLWGQGVRNGGTRYSLNVDLKDDTGAWRWLYCPYGKAGDRLWVRETFHAESREFIHYRADGWDYDTDSQSGWKPSIHMPRWAARLILEITEVRVEQLQTITENDAQAEGAPRGWYERDTLDGPETVPTTYAAGYRSLWDSINAKRGYPWSSNPWVWVLSFKRIDHA